MRLQRDEAVFVVGKAKSGKSTFAIEQALTIPKDRLAVLDFIAGDLKELKPMAGIYHRITKRPIAEAKEFLKFVYNKGDMFQIMDEAENYLNVENDFVELWNTTTRNRGNGYMALAKRPQNLAPFVRERANKLVMFNQTENNGIEMTANWLGMKNQVDVVDKNIRSLKNGEHFIYDLDNCRMSPKLKLNLKTHYVDVIGEWTA